ncbi:MAG: high frequency lysogenization protein HflD [Nitrospirae bacterium]|nr:high frequency lysogenization protein HflD [Nitrospirota bacterium]
MDTGSLGIFGLYAATFILGVMHAVEPGHGKTVVAAYLVGTKGRNADAVLLGLVVTLTHTFSIIVLALIAKFTSKYYSEEVLHSYLGIFSSLIILGLGAWMIKTRWSALRDPSMAHHHKHLFHSHDHGAHSHTHHHSHDHTHTHGHGHSHDHDERRLDMRGLIFLGISGGIIPCPAAIAILLAAASTGDIGKGLGLVLVFGAGLAAALVGIGLAVVNSVRLGQQFINTEKFAPAAAFLSAVVITIVGVVTLYSSLKHFPGAAM